MRRGMRCVAGLATVAGMAWGSASASAYSVI